MAGGIIGTAMAFNCSACGHHNNLDSYTTETPKKNGQDVPVIKCVVDGDVLTCVECGEATKINFTSLKSAAASDAAQH